MSGRSSTARWAAAAALLLTGAVPGVAEAGSTVSTAGACSLVAGSVTAGGDHPSLLVTATSPPTARVVRSFPDIYPDGQVRLSGTIANDPDITGTGGLYWGNVVIGSTNYASAYYLTEAGEVDRSRVYLTRVGGGWGDATFFDTTRYWKYPDPPVFTTQYSLRSNGTITRWDGSAWGNKQTATGFAAVKTMALISQTATYDTFLANTRGGALYTIRIPRTSPLKPVVKKVRDSTWQGFEALVIEKCGVYGTLLLGIDKDTHSGYLYAVGHANGTATVIKGLGRVPSTFADPVHFRHVLRPGDAQMLFGE
ncbi:hypothetical protein OHA10_33410 [Kribbella sp. NBC_00662]|uniref:hypothetical protein n=1 Tax=Kribbella sp. NBC_00662 TaxID=2975969 RepID=UPI0032565860